MQRQAFPRPQSRQTEAIRNAVPGQTQTWSESTPETISQLRDPARNLVESSRASRAAMAHLPPSSQSSEPAPLHSQLYSYLPHYQN